MSWRANLVLLVVAVLLSGYVFFFENRAPSWQRLGRFFPNLEPRDIFEIEIAQPAARMDSALGLDLRPVLPRYEAYEEETERWWIVKPFRFPAIHARTQGIRYLIADLLRVAEVGPETNAFPPEGPVLSVRFKTRQAEEWTVEVGNDHVDPEWDVTYVRVDGDTFVTKKEFRKNAQVVLDNLRSRALCPVGVSDAQRIRIELAAAGGEPRRERLLVRDGTSNRWRLEEPLSALADRAYVEDLIEELVSWRVREFVQDDVKGEEALARFGLAKPRIVLTVAGKDGRSFTVEIGDDVPGKLLSSSEEAEAALPQVYARHAGKPFVYRVEAGVLDLLQQGVETFRSRYLFELGTDTVTRLRAEIMRGQRAGDGVEIREVIVGDDDPRWQVRDLRTDEVVPGDEATITGILEEIRRLKIDRFLAAEEVAGLDVGLSPPWATVQMTTAGERELQYSLGARSQDPVDVGLDVFYTQRQGEPGAYLALSRLRRLLESASHAFRNRSLSTVDPVDVHELEFYLRGAESGTTLRWSVGRVPGAAWVVSEDTPLEPGRQLDSDLIDQLVAELHHDTFRALRYYPEIRDFAEHRIELTRPQLGLRLVSVGEGDYEGFRKLVVGLPLEEATGIEYLARVDLDGVPPFAVNSQVPTLLEKITRHLKGITRR
jgi:hypothetical protein